MQKLKFINGNGVEVDFTSGNFGIVNWSGFSESDLNIQTQQVPFNDGSVFLDALIQDRVINVTLAINDEKNLEKRYELRRQIIALMNPKLGLGKLIYENDIFQRQIECIPQLPNFPTKNFNDTGTVKASLSFTCSSPYWEDVEETALEVSILNQPIINVEGDIESQIEIDVNATNCENFTLTNLTTDEKLQIKENLIKGVIINTNTGKKSIFEKNYIAELPYGIPSGIKKVDYFNDTLYADITNYVVESKDGNNWKISKLTHLGYFCEKFNKYYRLTTKGIYSSEDCIEWELSLEKELFREDYWDMCFAFNSQNNILLMANTTYRAYTTDGINWTVIDTRMTGSEAKMVYDDEINKFIIHTGMKVYISENCTDWQTIDYLDYSLSNFGFTYNSDKKILIIVAQRGVKYSDDGVTWNDLTMIPEGYNCQSIRYSPICKKYFIATAVNSISVYDADFNEGKFVGLDKYVRWVEYLPKLNSIVGYDEGLYKSVDGDSWDNYSAIDSIDWLKYDDGFYYGKYNDRIVKSKDFKNIEITSIPLLWENKIEDKYYTTIRHYLSNNKTGYSFDKINYTELDFDVGEISKCDNFWFGSECYYSADGLNWNVSGLINYPNDKYIMNEKVSTLFRGLVIDQKLQVSYSTDGNTETTVEVADVEFGWYVWFSFYDNRTGKCFIVLTDGNYENYKTYISFNCVDWYYESDERLRYFKDENTNDVYEVVDGILYKILEDYSKVEYLKLFSAITPIIINGFVFQHYGEIVYNSIKGENIIDKLSADSSMSFHLQKGENVLRLNYSSGNAIATIKFKNKYLGV